MTRRSVSVLGIPTLPAPPGKSEFHVKGVVYAGIFSRLAQEPEAAAKLRAELADPELHRFYDQLFLASGWYDVFPIVPLIAALARVRSISFDVAAAEGARIRVTEDLNSIYRSVLRGTRPDEVAKRLTRGFSRYLDFGRAEVTSSSAGAIEISTSEMPTFLLPWYMPVAGTFFRVALESAGARDVRVSWRAPEDDGRRRDILLSRVHVALTWR